MKTRKKNDFDDFSILTDYNNLYKAHLKSRSGKRWKDSVAVYDLRALESTLYLKYLLETGKYKMQEYYCFKINERGKMRDIKSAGYKDRVVQRSLNDNILVPRLAPTFIYDNGASLPGKGTDFSLDRLETHLKRHYRKHGLNGYILIGDFKGYFDNINHRIINEMYRREFKDEKIIKLIEHIHATIPGGVGVPLGNQLSQFDALLMASPIDHFIKEKLRIKGYGRYMDDFYLIHESKDYLKHCLQEIKQEAAGYNITLHPVKTKIVPIKTGINFLGFHISITETGKVVRRIKAKSKSRQRRRLRKFKEKVIAGEMTYKQAKEAYFSWRAHAARGTTYYMLQETDCYFYNLFFNWLSAEDKKHFQKLKRYRAIRRRRKNGKANNNPARGGTG